MDDTHSGSSTTSGENLGFFDMAAEDAGASSDENRIQVLKRMLFDLAFLVMNADGTEHISEKMLIRELKGRMEREGSVDVGARTDDLAPILDEGPDAIREHVLDLADDVAEHSGDRLHQVADGFLDLLKGLIVSDASIAKEEYELFETLCDRWSVEKNLPRS